MAKKSFSLCTAPAPVVIIQFTLTRCHSLHVLMMLQMILIVDGLTYMQDPVLQDLLTMKLEDYASEPGKSAMDLVLFRYAVFFFLGFLIPANQLVFSLQLVIATSKDMLCTKILDSGEQYLACCMHHT